MLNDLTKIDLDKKTVIIRVDYNVPLENANVVDDTRILQSLPTILYCLKNNAKVILLSHLGRPGGVDPQYSLRPVYEHLLKILPSHKIYFFGESVYNAKSFVDSCVKYGDICLLENIRFYPEEENCDINFSKALASLGDIYVNDAFSVSHRKHSSVYGIAQVLPAYAGFSLANEVYQIDNFLGEAVGPKMCIIGGAKVSTKLPLIRNLLDKVDTIVCGGGIGSSFANVKFGLKCCDFVGDYLKEINYVLAKAQDKIIIPTDFCGIIDDEITFFDVYNCKNLDKIAIYDVGPESIKNIVLKLKAHKTILWNGPVGKFEEEPFSYGTRALAEAITTATSEGSIKSIIGGGDTLAAINKFVGTQNISYASTSGGAFLEYLEGKVLPGIEAVSAR